MQSINNEIPLFAVLLRVLEVRVYLLVFRLCLIRVNSGGDSRSFISLTMESILSVVWRDGVITSFKEIILLHKHDL